MEQSFSSCGGPANSALKIIDGGPLGASSVANISVGMLCDRLSARFPSSDAESWDRQGLLAGDPHAALTRVAIALDPTLRAVSDAKDAGCNVLVTHHPAFLAPPTAIVRQPRISYSGSVVYEAVASHVALINFHTSLDVSLEAQRILPGMLGFSPSAVLEPLRESDAPHGEDGIMPAAKGYGQVCRIPHSDPMTLGTLAARCLSVFGRMPRVWGDSSTQVGSLCTWTGSSGGAAHACLTAGIDVLVCGEIKYHEALEVMDMGLCVIELGHDVSELPLTKVLAQAVLDCGIQREDIVILNQNGNWQTPESRRV